MLRFINEEDITSGKNITLLSGLYRGILLHYYGQNKDEQRIDASNLDNFSLYRNGKPLANILFSHLKKWNSLSFGTLLQSSNPGGRFDLCFYVPFFEPFNRDLNAVPFSKHDYITLKGLGKSIVEDATVSVYGDMENLPFLYLPTIFSHSETLSSQKPIYIPSSNIYTIMYDEPSTPPTKIILVRDGMICLDIPYSVAEVMTNMEAKLESGTEDFAIHILGNYANIAGRKYEMQMVGGSGELKYTIFAIGYQTLPTFPTEEKYPGGQVRGPFIAPEIPKEQKQVFPGGNIPPSEVED